MHQLSSYQSSTLDKHDVFEYLRVDPSVGLNFNEVSERRDIHGRNEFETEADEPFWKKFIDQFKEPMILLLLSSAIVSLIIGQYNDSLSISLAIFIVCTVAFIQNYRSEKALESLKKLMPHKCHCLRDETLYECEASDLVPGDIVHLSVGDRIPADLRIFECNDLQIDESNLTGEVDLVRKHTNPISLSHCKTFSHLNQIPKNSISHSQTSVNLDRKYTDQDSKSSAFVNLGFEDDALDKPFIDTKCSSDNTNVLASTIYAPNHSAHELLNIAFMGTLVRGGNAKGIVIATGQQSTFGEVFKLMQSEEAPRTPLQRGMDLLGKQLSMISLGIIVLIVICGLTQHRKLLELFNVGVSLAVAAIPEGLPIVVTVTLAIGQMRMASRNAIVKKLPAVETLGCVNVICTDKTGTITKNEMTVTKVVTTGLERVSVTGVGYDARAGELILDSESFSPAHINGNIRRLIEAGCFCNNAELKDDFVVGQPTEGALLVLAAKAKIQDPRKGHKRIEENPFSSETKIMSVTSTPRRIKGTMDSDNHGHPICIFVKGSPDNLISTCESYRGAVFPSSPTVSHSADVQDGQILPLNQNLRETFLMEAQTMGQNGLRVLALAEGSSMDRLILLGIVGLMDPPRPGVDTAIETIFSSGVNVIMITGDARETACTIAGRLGIFKAQNLAISGTDVDQMDLCTLSQQIHNITVFYRTSPKHKCKIVKALQNNGLVVAMTGDGVNDAVAVKSADVGVAMGQGGTDVCKEAADIVLVNNDFACILSAMEEGKAIFHNIRNFVRFQLSTSISALSLIALSTLLKMPSPLNPMQILYINILMDGPPAQSLGVEPPDNDVIRHPPRKVRDSILNTRVFINIILSAAVIVSGTMLVFYQEMTSDGRITPRDTTMSFTCFVLFDIFNALSCRSNTRSIFSIGLFSNRFFVITVLMSLIGQLLVIYTPPFQSIFQTESLSFIDLVKLVSLSSTVFLMHELKKFLEFSPMTRGLRTFIRSNFKCVYSKLNNSHINTRNSKQNYVCGFCSRLIHTFWPHKNRRSDNFNV